MSKIARDKAQAEIESWLEYKKVGDKKREVGKDYIDLLIDSLAEGDIILKEDKSIEHMLKFPLEGEETVSKLVYKPRIKVQTIQAHMNGVKASDGDGRILATIAAISSSPKAIIQKLDTEDYGIATGVAYFFL